MMTRRPRKSLSTNKRHLIWVERRTQVEDGEGGYDSGWARTTGVQIWASVAPIKAIERTEYQTVDVKATDLVRVDGYVDVLEKDRVRFGTRILEILTVENIQERDIVKVCTCQELR